MHCINPTSGYAKDTGSKFKSVHSDNAFKVISMKKTSNKGKVLTTSMFYCQQSKKLAEGTNRTSIVKVRALVQDASLTWKYCGDALNHTVTLYSGTILQALNSITPQQSFQKHTSQFQTGKSGMYCICAIGQASTYIKARSTCSAGNIPVNSKRNV